MLYDHLRRLRLLSGESQVKVRLRLGQKRSNIYYIKNIYHILYEKGLTYKKGITYIPVFFSRKFENVLCFKDTI